MNQQERIRRDEGRRQGLGARAGGYLRGLMLLVVGVAGAGCAGASSSSAGPRVMIRQEAAEFVIEGPGRIEGGDISCSQRAEAVCSASFEDTLSTLVVALPERGARFLGWRRSVRAAQLSPFAPVQDVVVYTARFEPELRAASATSPGTTR